MHCGSTLGLVTPSGVQTDDGQWIMPSKLQTFLWESHVQFREDIRAIIKAEKNPTTHLFLMGDQVDGAHHLPNTQIVSSDEGLHIQIAADVLEQGLLKLKFKSVHMIRGTPAHVGKASGLEKAVANHINTSRYPIARDPKTDSFLWPVVFAEFGGVLFDIRHHGVMSQLARMRKSHAANRAQELWQAAVNEKRRPADFCIRSHRHQAVDSGPDHVRGMTRLIQVGCWQFSSEWVKSRSIESKPDIGGLVIVIRDGRAEVIELYDYAPDPDPQPIWRHDERV